MSAISINKVLPAHDFISSLSQSLQALSQQCMEFDSGIQIIGYIAVNIDNGCKVDYVLDERVQKSNGESTTFESNSFLAKKDLSKNFQDEIPSPVPSLASSSTEISPQHKSCPQSKANILENPLKRLKDPHLELPSNKSGTISKSIKKQRLSSSFSQENETLLLNPISVFSGCPTGLKTELDEYEINAVNPTETDCIVSVCLIDKTEIKSESDIATNTESIDTEFRLSGDISYAAGAKSDVSHLCISNYTDETGQSVGMEASSSRGIMDGAETSANQIQDVNPVDMEALYDRIVQNRSVVTIPDKKEKDCTVCSNPKGPRKRSRTMCKVCQKGLHGICLGKHKCKMAKKQ